MRVGGGSLRPGGGSQIDIVYTSISLVSVKFWYGIMGVLKTTQHLSPLGGSPSRRTAVPGMQQGVYLSAGGPE